MEQSVFRENSRALRRAVSADIVDVGLHAYRDAPIEAMRWIEQYKPVEIGSRDPEKSIHQNAQALRTVVHTFGRTDADFTQDNLIELARFVVPENNIGYVTNLEQYLADENGAYIPTMAEYLGAPYSETVGGQDEIVWYLQIQQTINCGNRFAFAGAAIANYQQLLPGRPFADLPVINGLWYPASKQNCFRCIVPSHSTLRLFVWLPAASFATYNWVAAGRLTCSLQSSLCKEALVNTRTLF